MESFSVASGAAAVAKRKRHTHLPSTIEEAVSSARHIGAVATATKLNAKLPPEGKLVAATIDTWLHRFKKEGKFWEKSTKRGRRALLDTVPGMREELDRQVSSFQTQGAPVTGRVAASILKATMEEKAPSLLDRHGGAFKIGSRCGRDILSRTGLSYRKKTSSKIIPPAESLADIRDEFYKNILGCFPDEDIDRELVLNFDQTFHCYNPTRGYTWVKKGSDRVALRESKDGFTFLPVVHAAGLVGAQMIFDGTTAASLPSVPPGPQLRFTQTENHWSNEQTTLDLFRSIIFPHIAARRAVLGRPAAPAIVLADAFPPHWTPKVKDLVAAEDAIAYVAIPDSLTHVFQPLDLGIIAAIKNSVMRRIDDFREGELRTAIRENRGVVLSKSRPVLRNRLTQFVKECLADPVICAEHCCKVGFERAGILRVLYGEGAAPDVDLYVPAAICEECGEPAVARDAMPPCACFPEGHHLLICNGCFANHSSLCPPA